MTEDLSLWNIEQGLAEVLQAREEAATAEEQKNCDQAIAAYVRAEVEKVDGIANYIRYCESKAKQAESEAIRLNSISNRWANRKRKLMESAKLVMEATGRHCIEGELNTLSLKNNGGKQAVEITNPAMIPSEYCVYQGTIGGKAWMALFDIFKTSEDPLRWLGREDVQMERKPMLAAIEQALSQKCDRCDGNGRADWVAGECVACGGTGKNGVPGARLAERGTHLEVK